MCNCRGFASLLIEALDGWDQSRIKPSMVEDAARIR
jgi:hypothetical protein